MITAFAYGAIEILDPHALPSEYVTIGCDPQELVNQAGS